MEKINPIQDLVIDTPNPLLYHAHRGFMQIKSNRLALINFLAKPQEFNIVAAVTPMMKSKFPKLVLSITKLVNASGGSFFETKGNDPDMAIIDQAIVLDAHILSNDKYRDYPQFSDFVNSHRLSFEIQRNKIMF